MKHGFREFAAALKGERYNVDADIRSARGVALQLFDLRKRQADADRRVATARETLERIDVSALEAELAAALADQAAIAEQLAALTVQAGDEVVA